MNTDNLTRSEILMNLNRLTHEIQKEITELRNTIETLQENGPLERLEIKVCEVFEIPLGGIFTNGRDTITVHAKSVFWNIARYSLNYSLSHLARYSGYNHATIHHHTKQDALKCRVRDFPEDAARFKQIFNYYAYKP